VKVHYEQSMQELAEITTLADDYFCRWDAVQKIMQHYVKQLTIDSSTVIPQSFFNMLKICLTDIDDDAFKALLLTLPSFDELVTSIERVDAIALCDALRSLKQSIAQTLSDEILSTYTQAKNSISGSTSCSIPEKESQNVAGRALQNICLSYLVELDVQKPLIIEQFQQSTNMTDALGALSIAAKANIDDLPKLLESFENKWQGTSLVMDKWFTVCASIGSEDILEQIEILMKREDFTLKNPNRARSLIGAFVVQNPRYFHGKTGQGYQFLADQIIALNKINPQVASRLITPLIQFKEFDEERQNLMKNELVRIQSTPKLARDLVEKLDAALS